MGKNLSKVTQQILLAVIFYFGQVFVFCRLMKKSVLEWFLLTMSKESTLSRSTNLFSKIHPTLFLIKVNKSIYIASRTY